MSTEPHITLAAILPTEISSTDTVALPPLRTLARADLEASGSPSTLTRGAAGELQTRIEREIPELWELRTPVLVPPHQLDVTYELRSSRGRQGHLSHLEQESSDLQVGLRAIPPTVVRRDGDTAVIQGGVVLVFDVSSAELAGTYVGTLTTTVTQL